MRLQELFKTWRVSGSTLLAELFGGIAASGPIQDVLTTVAYSAAPVIDASLGNHFVTTISDAVAFVVGAPINPPPTGHTQDIYYTLRNGSGGAHGAGTWNAIFKTSGNVPAIANANSRTFGFRWNGTNWVEFFRTAADVAN